jgi:hypothetical protein
MLTDAFAPPLPMGEGEGVKQLVNTPPRLVAKWVNTSFAYGEVMMKHGQAMSGEQEHLLVNSSESGGEAMTDGIARRRFLTHVTFALSVSAAGGSLAWWGSVANFDFRGKIRKSALVNSMTYRCQNSRKSNFATEPEILHDGLPMTGIP